MHRFRTSGLLAGCARSRLREDEELYEEGLAACQPAAIGHHIVQTTLRSFRARGVYVETPPVPCVTPRSLILEKLSVCDPATGSCSEKVWFGCLCEFLSIAFDEDSYLQFGEEDADDDENEDENEEENDADSESEEDDD